MKRFAPVRDSLTVGGGAAAALGVAESAYLWATQHPPDLWAFIYASVLYGAVGAGIGAGLGLAALVLRSRFYWMERIFPAAAGVCTLVPVGTFVLRYVVNKEYYSEQGVPVVVLALIVAFMGLVGMMVGELSRRTAYGRWGLAAWALVTVLLGGLPVAFPQVDPREGWRPIVGGSSGETQAPNVLFVMVDTLRADHVGALGADFQTPAIDGLAADGVVFEQAFAAASWTRAAGASLWTSRIPSGHGASLKASRLPDEAVTYAEVLRTAGFANGALINNINLTQTFNFDQGFDAFYYEAPEYRLGATESVFGLTLFKVVQKVAERLDPTEKVERYYQPASAVLGDARRFIDGHRGRRWSLFVHLMEPHDPYFEHPSIAEPGSKDDYNGVAFGRAEVERPAPDQADYLRRIYKDEVSFMDRELGPFIEALKASGVYDSTLIVFTADHGEEFNEHGGFWHGTTLFDEQLHVPLIVKLPGQALAGTRVPWQVRTMDVPPTLTGVLGLSPDPSWEGRDLIADVRRWQASGAARAASACGPDEFERPVVSEQNFEGNDLASLRAGGAKWIRANTGNPRGLAAESLFDVGVDPGEQRNLVGSDAQLCGIAAGERSTSMNAELERAVKAAASGAHVGGNAQMGASECERLKALGYMAPDEPCQ